MNDFVTTPFVKENKEDRHNDDDGDEYQGIGEG